MAEETQVLSIQDRIRALKQAQAQGPSSEATGSPLLGNQPTAFALRPASSQLDDVSSPPPPYSDSPPVPPPVRNTPTPGVPKRPAARSGVAPPTSEINIVPPPGVRQQPKKPAPPPLPTRKSSSQLAPTLPPRRPSVDSVASDASRSTSTSAGRSTSSKATTPGPVVKAPPWGATELPPLPPKRQTTQPTVLPSRPKPTTVGSNGRLPPPRPSLPSRQSSNQSVSTVSTQSSLTESRAPPPQLPQRNIGAKSPSPPAAEETNGQSQTRRLPPPPPTGGALNKLRGFGLESVNKKVSETKETAPSSTPPPVPLASRPDLSAIQATKPRISVPNGGASTPVAAVAAACMKCRDFSAPDTHAARYPRQSLPSQDLRWLALELTTPFISATDKARAIFTWLHHNIDYDVVSFFGNCVKGSTPQGTFASGLAVCQGYAELFQTLATHAGLEAKVVSGHGKGIGYGPPAPGAPLPAYSPTGHAWNVVRIDNGQWKLIDACWGAGHVQGPGQPYVRKFNPAQFTDTNDEFGLKHYPKDRTHFYRDDGRPEITWEEYILGNPNSPLSAAQPKTFTNAKDHSIGERSFRPAATQISLRNSPPGPMRFQFNLICEHWTLERHSRTKPGLFLLCVNGVDGRKAERIPLIHWRGSGPDGGGDIWYIDVPDVKTLGAPGQKVQIAVLTKIGQQQDARGVTREEFLSKAGKVGMSWSGIAEWELVV
ncbi:hypothetical protein BDV18DRAFT_144521 [Aspergillus unguis]